MLLQIMANLADRDFNTGSKTHARDETDCASDADLSPRLQLPQQQQLATDTEVSGTRNEKLHDKLSGNRTCNDNVIVHL